MRQLMRYAEVEDILKAAEEKGRTAVSHLPLLDGIEDPITWGGSSVRRTWQEHMVSSSRKHRAAGLTATVKDPQVP